MLNVEYELTNLNASVSEARLSRRFRVHEQTDVQLNFGFSDEISIRIDDELVFEGEHKFQGITNSLGYVSLDKQVSVSLSPGIHTLDILSRKRMDCIPR